MTWNNIMIHLPKLNTILLGTILFLLATQFYLGYAKPFFALKKYAEIYGSLHLDCESALDHENLLVSELGLSTSSLEQLRKSLAIEKLSCDERSLVRNILLSAGVEEHQLNVIKIDQELNI